MLMSLHSLACRQIIATEVSKSSVAAARANLVANGVSNAVVVRMSSEEFTAAWQGERAFERLRDVDFAQLHLDTLLVDPPRAGLDDDTMQLLSRFARVVYISCNPATLHSNLLHVKDSHAVSRFALFDQFPYSEHIECGVLLTRKDEAI